MTSMDAKHRHQQNAAGKDPKKGGNFWKDNRGRSGGGKGQQQNNRSNRRAARSSIKLIGVFFFAPVPPALFVCHCYGTHVHRGKIIGHVAVLSRKNVGLLTAVGGVVRVSKPALTACHVVP